SRLEFWPSVSAIGWGSVLGNTLDRGFGYTPLGEHSQAQCGLEVVLPNGDLLRTGMGAMKASSLFPLYKRYFSYSMIPIFRFSDNDKIQSGYGPKIDGMFFHSNLGAFNQVALNSIVTKLGIHITPAPEAYATVEVSVPREEDLVPLVGTLSDLVRRSVILNSPSIANIFRIALTSREPEVHGILVNYMKPGSNVPYEVLEDIQRKQGWGFWKAYFSLYAPTQVLPSLLAAVKRAFTTIEGVRIDYREFSGSPGKFITVQEVGEEEIPNSGIPTLAPLAILDSRQKGSGHICFPPIIPPSGREMYSWYLTAKKRTYEAGFDFFADFHVYPQYAIGIDLVIYTASETLAIDRLYRQLLTDAAEQGYSEYGTHVSYMGKVTSHFDFNDSAIRRFNTTIKDLLDPNGILSPGKSRIWNSQNLSRK
ncbi:FAD-linked oxidase-like protein, partial [Penicillium malachiteum]